MHRVAIMLCVALPLAAADLFVKASTPTQPWAYHQRSLGWLVLSLALLAAMPMLARIPSPQVAPAAGVLCAGILGNSLSAAWNGMEVPNPFIIDFEHALVAFNLADLWALAGIFLLVLSIGLWLIRNRHLLPPPARVQSARGEAFPRLSDDAER